MGTTMTMSRSSMWAVDSRVIVYSAIGAALYGVLVGLFKIPVPGTTAVDVRPAFALVPFFGFAFGPIVGLFTGLVGNMIGDQISGWGLLTSYNWSLANGAVGLIAGLAPMFMMSMMAKSLPQRAIAGAIAGAIGVVVGLLIVFTDIIKDGLDFNAALGEYVPAVVGDLIATIILVPVLVYAWEPVKERLGR
ncbi:MAG TPA: ECF transporter S component [Candidatus Limnocylindrales bacterium]|jgi:energy-coupling factor transport system substrate-specific component|nr:ECF transporter S component [Candidatus Limnocylindrales bacterium]